MKAIVFVAVAALAATGGGPVGAADLGGLEGLWATQSSGGIVEIAPCGEAVCGSLVRSPFLGLDPTLRDWRNKDAALRARPLMGVAVLSGFTGGPGRWVGGRIYNPDDGRTYEGSLQAVSPDAVKVSGCSGLRCRTQVWYRVRE